MYVGGCVYHKHVHLCVDCVHICVYIYVYVYVCLYVTMHVDVYVPIPRAKNASFCSSLTRCLLLTCSMSYISNDVCVPSLYMYGVCMRGK